MLPSNWSQVLRSDLEKLSQLSSTLGKGAEIQLKEGERRIVTVLFLDIQGFTAMSEKLDPEDVQLIIDNCFKILTNEIEKFQGYIDKYEGDRMMALFGSRQATDQDCERALRAALGMKEKFLGINQILAERSIKIGIRIGINTGLVVTGRIGKARDQDFTVMGDAVNLASRLETNAPPGEILVSEEVRRSAGGVFLYESLGEITVKGKSQPLPVFVVKGLNPDRTERWERSPFSKRSGYVRRQIEHAAIEELASALRATGQGIGTIAFSAPAGTGKSRLVYEFFRQCQEQGPTGPILLRGTTSADQTLPLGLFIDLIRRTLSDPTLSNELLGDERFLEMLRAMAELSEPAPWIRALEGQALQLQMHLAIRFLFERLSQRALAGQRGLLVVHFEDLQWIDTASLEAMDFLGSNLQAEGPILFLWTYRPEFTPSEKLKNHFLIKTIELKPLSTEECGAILNNVLGEHTLTSSDQEVLVKRSGGNPFFIEELIQSLADEGILQKSDETWKLTRPIEEVTLPDSVNRILLGRIDRLDSQLKEVLMAASVIGETLPLSVLERVMQQLGLDAKEIELRLKGLEDLGFLYRRRELGPLGRQLQFRHALTRDVVYSALLNHNKKILHESVARSYENIYGDRALEHGALLYQHFSNAGLDAPSVQYGLAALEQMVRQYASREGLRLAEKLRPLLTKAMGEMEVFEAELRISEAEIRLYDFTGDRVNQLLCVEALEKRSEQHPESKLQARSSLYRALYCVAIGELKAGREHAIRGLSTMAEKGRVSRLRMELLRTVGLASYSTGDYSDALSRYREGLMIAKELGERSAEGGFYNAIGLVHFNLGEPNEALQFYEKASGILTEIGDRRGEGSALGNSGLVWWSLGEYSRALEGLTGSHHIFQQIGFRKGQAVTLGNIGVIYHKLGQYASALDCYQRAISLRRAIHDRAGEGFDLVNSGVVHMHLYEFDRAIEYFLQGEKLAREVGSKYLLSENLNNLAIIHRKLGETDVSHLPRAKALALEALEVARSHQLIPGQVKALSSLGRTYFLLGEIDEALAMSHQAMDLVRQHAHGVEGAEEDAIMNHYLILHELGRQPEAKETLEILVRLIEERAVKIKNLEYRKSFLENVRQNRFALEEWGKLKV